MGLAKVSLMDMLDHHKQRGTPIGENADMFKSRRKPDSANIAASCVFPSEKKKNHAMMNICHTGHMF